MLKLNHSFKIYIPSTVRVDQSIDNKESVNKTLKYFSKCFGGATAQEAIGGWIAENNKLVVEDVTICYSYCNNDQFVEYGKKIFNYAKRIKKELEQEAVSLEVDNQLYLI